jgi:hypothetical protein
MGFSLSLDDLKFLKAFEFNFQVHCVRGLNPRIKKTGSALSLLPRSSAGRDRDTVMLPLEA